MSSLPRITRITFETSDGFTFALLGLDPDVTKGQLSRTTRGVRFNLEGKASAWEKRVTQGQAEEPELVLLTFLFGDHTE